MNRRRAAAAITAVAGPSLAPDIWAVPLILLAGGAFLLMVGVLVSDAATRRVRAVLQTVRGRDEPRPSPSPPATTAAKRAGDASYGDR